MWNMHRISIKPTKFEQAAAAASGRYRRVPLSYTHLPQHESSGQNLMPLKVLNGSFVFLSFLIMAGLLH